MQRNYSDLMTPSFKRQSAIDFDMEIYQPNPESIKIYEELNAISEEIEECRKRNCR